MPETECGPLHDLCRPYQSIWHSQSLGTFEIMTKFSFPAKSIAMVWQFHDGMLASVQNDGEFSDPFPVINGKARLYTSFNTVQYEVFCHAYRCFPGCDNGIPIRYRFDGKVFNLRRLRAKSRVQIKVLDEFLLLMTWQKVLQQKRECKKL